MIRFVLSRVLLVIPTFIGILFLTFVLVHLIPGDPVEIMLGEHVIDPARHAMLMHQLGLDEPLYIQFASYVWHVLQGDLGISLQTRVPVLSEFLTLFPATLELSICAMLFAVVFGLPAGMVAALRRGTIYDHALMGTSLTGYSMPIFWWGLMLIVVFSVQLQWTPVSGRIDADFYFEDGTGFMLIDAWNSDDEGAFTSALSHLILPTIVLGTIPLAVVARMTRSSMLEVLGEDYVRTARAKGLAGLRVIGVHALRNALIPVVTVIGLQVGVLMGGAILTETIFSWPGVGRLTIQAISNRDYYLVQGCILAIGLTYVAVNFLTDLLYSAVNPRIRQ